MDKVFPGCWVKSRSCLCASTCYASLDLAALDVELVWFFSLKSDCLCQEEPQFFQEWAGARVSPTPVNS